MNQYDPLLSGRFDGTVPDIITYLEGQYSQAIQTKNAQATAADAAAPLIDELAAMEACQIFCNFARKFLRDNPPAEVFYPAGSIGLKLTNMAQVVLTDTGSDMRGSMQSSQSHAITGGQYVGEAMAGAPVIGQPQHLPENQPTRLGGATDMTQQQGTKSYDK